MLLLSLVELTPKHQGAAVIMLPDIKKYFTPNYTKKKKTEEKENKTYNPVNLQVRENIFFTTSLSMIVIESKGILITGSIVLSRNYSDLNYQHFCNSLAFSGLD